MSGTSLDGIDLAWIVFEFKNKWSFEIRKSETISYSEYWKTTLKEAITCSEEQLERLDFKLTDKFSEEILKFMRLHGIQTVDAVCSHGHTVFHRPDKGWTLQIGNLPRLAQLIERKVVCDFRVQDVELGGQGAPLVPVGDRLLFPEFDYCLNLGGFANVSFEKNGERVAYDICPVNIVLNVYAETLGKPFDPSGSFARSGDVDQNLLDRLNSLSFYSETYPKSLGLEWVRAEVFPLIQNSGLSSKDILATYTEHIAFQISRQFSLNSSVLVTGGGAYNDFLIERLKHHANACIKIPDPKIVDFKEALIFGLLGVLKLRNEINCLSSVTGASKNHSSGKVYFP